MGNFWQKSPKYFAFFFKQFLFHLSPLLTLFSFLLITWVQILYETFVYYTTLYFLFDHISIFIPLNSTISSVLASLVVKKAAFGAVQNQKAFLGYFPASRSTLIGQF